MSAVKHSPMCARDEGREVYFTAKTDGKKYRFTLPRALLDDACGDAASEADRKDWAKAHVPDILATLTSATAAAPFDRIRVEEIS